MASQKFGDFTVEDAPADGAQSFGGYTVEDAPNTASMFSKAVKGGVDFVKGVAQDIRGRQDPKFGNLPTVQEVIASGRMAGTIPLSALSRAKLAAPSDAGMVDIYRKQLGDRFLGVEQDANGFHIITMQTKNGPQKAYVNRPGLDTEDVDRGVSAALPFVVGGGAVGAATKGMNLMLRMGAQGLAGAGISVGQDIAAQGSGSQQGIDPVKAAATAAGGVVGEGIGAVIGRWLASRGSGGLVDDATGALTEKGRKAATDAGLDPDLVDNYVKDQLKQHGRVVEDQRELIRSAQADEFGLRPTKGQRTENPQQLNTENDIRSGTLGEAARKDLEIFEREQANRLAYVARGVDDTGTQQGTSIAKEIAPKRSPAPNKAELGEGAQAGFDKARAAAKAEETAAWEKVGRFTAPEQARKKLAPHIHKAIGGPFDADLQPTASAMVGQLKSFAAGKAPKTPHAKWLGEKPVQDIVTMRKRLVQMVGSASSQSGDKRLAGKILEGFDEWLNEASAHKLLMGDPAQAAAIRNSKGATKNALGFLREAIAKTKSNRAAVGKAAAGKATPSTKILDKVAKAETGEEALAALLGKSSPGVQVKDGVVQAVRTYRNALQKFGGKEGADAWNDIRLAFWLRMVTGKDGNTASKGQMLRNINEAFANNRSLMNTLYTKSEQASMKRLGNAIKAITARNPNPSGTGQAVRALFPRLASQAAQTQATRETFSNHNVLLARVWRALATYVKQFEKTGGRRVIKRTLSQDLTRRPSSSYGGRISGIVGGFQPSTDRTSTNKMNELRNRR